MIEISGFVKSTMLKIVFGGHLDNAGLREVWLLTLGNGFDMGQSARENAYLNGVSSSVIPKRFWLPNIKRL